MKLNDKITLSVAEAVKHVIEDKKDFKPHTMYDPKTGKAHEAKSLEDHLKMKDMGYTHEKPSEKNETEVQDSDKDTVDAHTVDDKEDPEQKKYTEETEVEDEDDVEEGNAFGQAVTDAKKAGKKKFKFQGKEYKVESADLEEATDTVDINTPTPDAAKRLAKKLANKWSELRSLTSKGKSVTVPNERIYIRYIESQPEFEGIAESVDLEEAVTPADFVKGGDAKITKREVDSMLSKLFIDTKLAKAVESNSAFKAGEKSNGKKNPYKKDTADFHLFILGQQSAAADS